MFIPMKKDFKVGDYVGWNSEAGHVRGTIKKKDHLGHHVQGLHGPRLEGGAAVFDQKRDDRPSGHAQGIGAQETQEQTMSALRIETTADCVEQSMPKEEPSPLVMTIGHSTHTIEE